MNGGAEFPCLGHIVVACPTMRRRSDELGPACAGDERCKGQGGLLQAYVEEKANTALCSSKPPFKGCAKETKTKLKVSELHQCTRP
eukprot:COSAG01_NODE_2402_length_7759_cov_9.960313_14_plen_86_part_00